VFQPWITKAYTSVLGPNDNFADRITIAGTNINITGDNIGATGETGESTRWGSNSVWYTWTSPVSQRVVIDTTGSNYDTTLAIYTGSAINALTLLAENDDAVGLASRIAFTPTAGTTYQLAIGGFFGRQGFFNLNLTTVALSIGNVSLTEGNSSTTNATFTVNLSTISPETVIVDYATADGSATTANNDYQTTSGTLTFRPGITSQTITVPINGDSLFEGDETLTLNLSNPINAGLTTSSATGTIINDDNPGFTVSAISRNTTEAGGTGTFTIQLNTQPTADITLGLTSSNIGEGTVDKTSVTFTSTNWNVPQTVTVTGVDDFVVDGDIAYQIITAADTTTADTSYNNLKPGDVAVTNTDNDTRSITVNPTSGLTTTEAGGTATFTVVLDSQPTADVSIGMTSDNTAEGNVDKPSLTFTPANWNTPQTVTVTGVDESVVDGNVAYNIVTAATTSTDTNYSGINADDVAVTNTDNDTQGITVTPTSGLTTTEAGGTATFTVVLNSQPTADVSIGMTSDNTAEGTVDKPSLTFTSANWNTPQTVTVTGVDDLVVDGNVAYNIVTAAATSTDTNYSGFNADDVAVTNTDNDTAGFEILPISGNTSEFGGQATFDIRLTSQPTADVILGLTSNNTAEGTVLPANLTFNSTNWNAYQTVTITGVDDAVADGDIAYQIITTARHHHRRHKL
jgi:hypothetical protein